MQIRGVLYRSAQIIAAGTFCAWLTLQAGPIAALIIWSLTTALICTTLAASLARQKPDHITFINYAASFTMPWGYDIGRGKLPNIAMISWTIWFLTGSAAIIATQASVLHTPQPAAHPSFTIIALLFLTWIINGAALLQILAIRIKSSNRALSLRTPAPALTALIAASITISLTLSPRMAILLAAAPILLLTTGYALFLIAMLTIGRKTRWN